jgi:hypothetical protein
MTVMSPKESNGGETAVQVFTKGDPEPLVHGGTLAVVNYGDYRSQEVWVASGVNIGNWFPLGGEFGYSATPDFPTWDDVTARGPVTLVVAASRETYRQGWADGRQRLLEQIEELRDTEDGAR